MKCNYCSKEVNDYIFKKSDFGKREDEYFTSVVIIGNKLNIDSCADTYEPNYTEVEFEIYYCPMCGKKLKEKLK